MGLLDRMRAAKEASPKKVEYGKKTQGIYFSFKEGSNILRFVGDFCMVATHYLPGTPRFNVKGLCPDSAFEGEDRIPQFINCSDWDAATNTVREVKTCPICRLHQIAKETLRTPGLTKDERKEIGRIERRTEVKMQYKWNAIDRKDPYIVEKDASGEQRVKGYKVVSFYSDVADEILNFVQKSEIEISDVNEGIDFDIVMTTRDNKKVYSVSPVMTSKNKMLAVCASPLTEEEKAMVPHDLQRMASYFIDPDKIISHLHEDFRDTLAGQEAEQLDAAKEQYRKVAEEKRTPVSGAAKKALKQEVASEDNPECFGENMSPTEAECVDCACLTDCLKETNRRKKELGETPF